MQKVSTFLWFDKEAEEAMNYYVSVFKGAPSQEARDSEIMHIERYPGGYSESPLAGMEGKVLTGIFKLAGQQFMCLDGGPLFNFTQAMSLVVECEDQAEIDYFWDKLSADPSTEQCGWCKDKYGLPWQVVPKNMGELIQTRPAMDAMMQMKKIDIKQLQTAGKS